MTTLITLHEAADRLGVHYMTAYRYIRTGRLPATKVGAEWRVDPADLTSLTASAASPRPRRGTTDWAGRLVDRLVVADEAGAWAVIEQALTAGVEPEGVYLDVLAPALERIGDSWAAGDLSVADEHQASTLALRLIGRLGPRFRRRGRTRGSILLGAPPGDHHGVPVALLADVLRGHGFRVYDLGADVPAESFAETASGAERLVAVGIGATTLANERNIRRAVRTIRAATEVPVLLGGSAIDGLGHARRLGADAFAAKAPEALSYFEEVASRRGTGEQAS